MTLQIRSKQRDPFAAVLPDRRIGRSERRFRQKRNRLRLQFRALGDRIVHRGPLFDLCLPLFQFVFQTDQLRFLRKPLLCLLQFPVQAVKLGHIVLPEAKSAGDAHFM